MSSVYKYVMIRVGEVDLPTLFPSHLPHRGMTQAVERLLYKEAPRIVMDSEVISAGFVAIEANATLDRSESLDLSPRAEDLREINAQYRYAHSFRKM